MRAFLSKIFNYIYKLESRIAFYPTIISLCGLLFAFFMYYLENLNVSNYFFKHAPWLVIKNEDTARALLTTFVGGLISIMVFSFSMVMILLSQSSSNFSPRVLPGLISNRRHQIILGIYNACLLYCIFTLIAIEPIGDKYELPGISILIAIIFMTFCLGAFIYFIHSISQGIQINNIMSTIFFKAKDRLQNLIDKEKDSIPSFPDSSDWTILRAQSSGYIEDFDLIYISKEIGNHNAKADFLIYKGEYVFKGSPLLRLECKLSEDLETNLLSAFNFSKSELIEDNYVLAFKQITEITVKAMSPGINDPGTAINAIDYLTDLFLLRMCKKDENYYFNEDNEALIKIKSIDFKTLLYTVMASLRTYCKHDVVIVQKLMNMLSNMLHVMRCENNQYRDSVLEEIDNLYQDTTISLKNDTDIEKIKNAMIATKN